MTAGAPRVDRRADHGARLVLVVDDEADLLEIVADRLAGAGYRVLTARDGQEALERVRTDRPACVILDLKMGRMDGLQLLKAMRADARTSSVPVVMLSSSSEKRELDSCYEAGANSVVRKTVDFNELRLKMGKVYDFWITVNEANRHSRV